MGILHGNAIVGQSGGPTAAINATLAGVIKGCLGAKDKINKLYGMRNGIDGFMREKIIDISDSMSESDLELLSHTPSAALGSCRYKLKSCDTDIATYEKLFDLFKKYDIRYFFYIGGNDSMDTVAKLSEYAKRQDYEMRFIGVPKTIDNDLVNTDHTPGFGSAAKFVATTVKEILRDVNVYDMKAVTIVEIMGRDAGWLTTASALPAISGGLAPDLVYLPERAFDLDAFTRDVRAALDRHPAVLVCVSEGIKFASGDYVGAGINGSGTDAFGHVQLSGAGKVLENYVKAEIGCKVRSIELNLPQRCASHIASLTDITESVTLGAKAVDFALDGNSGVMVSVERSEGEYALKYIPKDVCLIANRVRRVPDEYINAESNGVTDACLEYLRPLIQGECDIVYDNGMPKHFVF